MFKRFLIEEKGQSTVEYVLILMLIVGVIFAVGAIFKKQIVGFVNQLMGKISSTMQSFMGGGG